MAEGYAHLPEGSTGASPAIKEYGRLRETLLECLHRMRALEPLRSCPCEELREKVEANAFNLVVVGQFKRGKTCLINALMGASLLPVAVVPLTSIVTVLTFGDALQVTVFFNDGTWERILPEELPDFVTEKGNPKNARNVREVVVSYPSSYLKDGVRLIDTPGVGSVYSHNTDVAYRYLPKSDAALFLLSVDQPVSQAELDFLRDVRQYADRIFFLLNKIDFLSEEEVKESIAFASRTLEEALGSAVRVFPVSAKLALRGKSEGGEALLRTSRLPAFSEVLHGFLLHEKGKILLQSVSGRLLQCIAQGRLELELELKSLLMPIEELKGKIRAFEEKKADVAAERASFDMQIEGELKRVVREVLDEDLGAFKGELTAQMEQSFEAFCESHGELALKELNEALERFVADEVQRAFSAWHLAEEERIARAFGAICERFSKRMYRMVDELLRFSSELFRVPYEAVEAEFSWVADSGFSYKLREDAVGLDMLATSLAEVVPGLVHSRFKRLKDALFRMANRSIVGKRRRHMLEAIEMQAGRVRYDFVDRLHKSRNAFGKEMLRGIDATLEGVGAAIEQGMDERLRGEEAFEARQAVLANHLDAMEAMRGELVRIRAAAGEL